MVSYCDSPEVLAAYLTDAFTDGDPALIAEALNRASRHRYGRGRKQGRDCPRALYKALRPGSQPRLETIMGVIKALGCKLVVEPIGDPESEQIEVG